MVLYQVEIQFTKRSFVFNQNNIVVLLLFAAGLILITQPEGCINISPGPSGVDRVTYVYEKDNTIIPKPVAYALQKLNEDETAGILASEFEQNTTDGNGEIPDQYKIALETAKEAGLPALVVQSGDRVVKVVKNPTTEEHVTEAVK